MLRVFGEVDETNGRFLLFQVDNLTPNWTDVKPCVKYLIDKGIQIDDVMCFDQMSNLKQFVKNYKSDEEFSNLPAHQKWARYFEKCKNIECHSQLLLIA